MALEGLRSDFDYLDIAFEACDRGAGGALAGLPQMHQHHRHHDGPTIDWAALTGNRRESSHGLVLSLSSLPSSSQRGPGLSTGG